MRLNKLVPILFTAALFACNKGKSESEEARLQEIKNAITIVKNTATKKYYVKVGESIVGELDAEYSYEPKLIGTFQFAPPYDRVILVQEFPMGNACDGGDVHLIGINQNGASSKIGEVPNCGVPDPIVDISKNKIILPSHPTNGGEAILPKVTYQFANQVLKNISLPVLVSFRKAMFGDGMVLIMKNNSNKNLSVVVRIFDPTTKEDKGYKMVINPSGAVKEFGHMEGWAFASGQKVTIENSEFEPAEIEVP